MLITNDTSGYKKTVPPGHPWQTGHYARTQEFRFVIPYGFLMLCKLFDVTPNELLIDFMDNCSCGSWKREGRDDAKVYLLSYIIEMKYGENYFTEKERLQLFTELDAIGMCWPGVTDKKMLRLHIRWRKKYYNCWFNKWFHKDRRKT
jgi:hypothetical protein